MKTQTRHILAIRRQRAALFSALLLPAFICTAQEDEEVFELSPFVISAEDSTGYAARNTLAGTRIKTDLKDLGSAISVVTAEFLEDTGATGLEDLLQYTTGTEIGGPNGNFSGIDFASDDASGSITGDDNSRINPAQGARVRGIAKPNFTRNYFSSDIRIDSYNTGGITISRGANSLLFGLGSAAGVVDNSVKMPAIGENSTKLSFRFGENGSKRGTVSLTRTYFEDRLAINVSALNQTTNFTQNPAFSREKRTYGAFNLTLFKNEGVEWLGKTSIRGNLESGEFQSVPPKALTPSVGYESFFLPPPDFAQYNNSPFFAIGGDPAFQAAWTKWKLIDGREQADGTPGYREAETLAGDYPVYSTPFFFNPPITTFQSDGTLTTGIPGQPNIAGFRTWANGNQLSSGKDANGVLVPENRIPYRPGIFLNTRAYEEGQQGSGFRTGTLTNPAVFDYRNNLLTGDMDRVENDFNTQTFFLEQSLFGGRGGIEIAVDQQRKETYSFLPFGGSSRNTQLYIDTTEYLPNGTLNPNAGKVFLSSAGNFEGDETRIDERESQRGIAFYNLDFNDFGDKLGFLGRHNFTALVQKEEYAWSRTRTHAFLSSDEVALRGNNPLGAGDRKFSALYYLTDESVVGKEMDDIRLNQLSKSYLLNDGDQFDILFYPYTGGVNGTKFPSVNNPTNTNITTATLQYNRFLDHADVHADQVESKALAWQSYLFDGHIVGLFGLREDDVTDFNRVRVNLETGETLYNANGTVNTSGALRVGDTVYPESIAARLADPDPTGRTKTWSVVGHLPSKYLENLPVSSVSAHYAVSENFQPGESGFDHNGDFLPAPQGETTEMGISLGFADNKWNLRVNKFETNQDYRTAQSLNGTINTARNRPLDWANNWWDLKLQNEGITAADGKPDTDLNLAKMVPDGNGGMKPNLNSIITEAVDLGFTSYDQIVSTILNIVPQDLRDRYQYALNEDGNQWITTGPGIDNLKAIQNLQSKGYEIELVGNPNKNWRTSINMSQIEAVPHGTAAALGEYAGAVLANLEKSNLSTLNESNTSIVDLSVRWGQVVRDIVNITSQDGRPIAEQRKYRANAVANYKVTEGKFKGFNIGGAMRYQSEVKTGGGLLINEDGIAITDPDVIFTSGSDTTIDSWISYDRKIMDNRVKWKIQLNVRNLFGDDDDVVVFTNPAGEDKIFRVAPDVRSWFVTNTFSF